MSIPYNQPNRRDMDPELARAMADVRWCDESTVLFSRYLGLDISVMERNYQRRFHLSVDSAADAFVGMDDTSTTVISPAMFEELNLDCTNERARICREQGKLYFHHSERWSRQAPSRRSARNTRKSNDEESFGRRQALSLSQE